MRKVFLSLLALPLLSASASTELATDADSAPDEVQVVSVNGIKDPELMSYRTLLAGLDAFEAHHDLAPAAPTLRFKLNSLAKDMNPESLSLRIQSDDAAIPVAIAMDGSFQLPRNQLAYEQNADLVLNQKKGSIRGREDVRTPGIPENMRRLGDLRLECQVRVAMAKAEMNMLQRAAITTVLMGTDWCQSKAAKRMSPAPAELKSAILLFGDRRLSLQIAPDKRYFVAPIADKTWPDDALIEFEFSDESLANGAH